MVIGFAPDVGMGGERSGRGFVGRHLVELGIQDIADALVGTDTGRQGAAASGFSRDPGPTGRGRRGSV